MKRIMLRVDDDLYTRIFETAHDQRLSMNAWIADVLDKKSKMEAESRQFGIKWETAERNGLLYSAKYMQYFQEKSEQFLTAREAADFLRYGEDEGDLSSIGVFDGAGNDLGWDYVKSPDDWPNQSNG